jgi:hypothetical protein
VAFQSAPHMEGRLPRLQKGDRAHRTFQSARPHGARPHGARPAPAASRPASSCFNPRPLEGATRRSTDSSQERVRFNPRPRKRAAHNAKKRVYFHGIVSIRTPARGATRADSIQFNIVEVVSIHAPVRRRHELCVVRDLACCVSIHAPTRGTTRGGVPVSRQFQSALPLGERPQEVRRIRSQRFQSTPPKEATRVLFVLALSLHSFQSTPQRGATARGHLMRTSLRDVSIHAPARGRPPIELSPAVMPLFQSALSLAGSDSRNRLRPPHTRVSTRAPHRGRPVQMRLKGHHLHHFNPHSREESDTNTLPSWSLAFEHFNPVPSQNLSRSPWLYRTARPFQPTPPRRRRHNWVTSKLQYVASFQSTPP